MLTETVSLLDPIVEKLLVSSSTPEVRLKNSSNMDKYNSREYWSMNTGAFIVGFP